MMSSCHSLYMYCPLDWFLPWVIGIWLGQTEIIYGGFLVFTESFWHKSIRGNTSFEKSVICSKTGQSFQSITSVFYAWTAWKFKWKTFWWSSILYTDVVHHFFGKSLSQIFRWYRLSERSQPTKTFKLYENIFRHFSCPCQFKVQKQLILFSTRQAF